MNKPEPISPPRWLLRFFRWFCHPDFAEDIEGDLCERFAKTAAETSARKARWRFLIEVLLLFRPGIIKPISDTPFFIPIGMFKHNLLITYRSYMRNKISFFINLIGLSSGLACVLLIYLWVGDELKMDTFHGTDSRLYQVLEKQEMADGIGVNHQTSGPLAQALVAEMPDIKYAATTAFGEKEKQTLAVGTDETRAIGLYASKDYFHLFGYELIQGNPDKVLADKHSIVLSEALALRFFGSVEAAIGNTLDYEQERDLSVSGVFKQEAASSVQFDFVMAYQVLEEEIPWITDWRNNYPKTFVVLQEGVEQTHFTEKIAGIVSRNVEGAENRSLFLQPYSQTYLYGEYENGIQSGGRIEYVVLFSIIALLILIIACVNFMNLSTAQATKRLKEVGVKKVMGASRSSLMVQHLGESLLMACLSLLVALLIADLFLPQFNEITGKELSFHFSLTFFMTLLLITLITGLISGSYPALYLSGLRPSLVLKGKLSRAFGEVWTRKGLVVFQFSLSIVMIVVVGVVYQQIQMIQTRDLGYNKENVLYLEAEGKMVENMEVFLEEIRQIPGVTSASSIFWGFMGWGTGTHFLDWEGKDPNAVIHVEYRAVNYDMIELLEIDLLSGRTFSREFATDESTILLNETAVEIMGLEEPLGASIEIWGNPVQVIGVVKDFNFASLHNQVRPLMFLLTPDNTGTIMAKIEPGREQETLQVMEAFYAEFNPGFPFDPQFLDTDYQAMYESEQRVGVLSQYFAGLALLISCLGLFGLATFNAERRIKEIGIRKVLGSSVWQIIYLLSTDFAKMVLVAIGIAVPISYLIAQNWLEDFAYQIELKWWLFAGAAALALLIALFTVSMQTLKAANVNPAQCLRNE